MGGEQHDWDIRPLTGELGDDVDAVEPGHAHVDERDVGLVPADELERAPPVPGLSHDDRSRGLERAHDALAIEEVIVHDDHPQRWYVERSGHGRLAIQSRRPCANPHHLGGGSAGVGRGGPIDGGTRSCGLE